MNLIIGFEIYQKVVYMNINNESKIEFIKKISAKLSEYEAKRKEEIQRLIKVELILFVIIFLSVLRYWLMYKYGHGIPAFLLVITLLVAFFFMLFPFICNGDFSKNMKDICRQIIKESFNINFLDKFDNDNNVLYECNLFSKFNYYDYDDVIQGEYNNVNYEIAEISLSYKENKKTFPVYSGVFIQLPFNKTIKAKTIITSKQDRSKMRNIPLSFLCFVLAVIFLPYIIVLLLKLSLYETAVSIFPITLLSVIIFVYCYFTKFWVVNDFEHTNLEDISFDDKYSVFTEDQVEGRYLVTPSFMERLLNIQTSFGTNNIKCSFIGNKMCIAISVKKNLFEICDLFTPMSDTKLISQFYDEIVSIQSLIDHFKLNEKTGL